ncbi:hypothetical protein JCM8097_000804 [Rhodosporidiobolus ruineniae]
MAHFPPVLLPPPSAASLPTFYPPPQPPQYPLPRAAKAESEKEDEPYEPRYTINDLPTEVKAKIVQMCADQDKAFKTWSTEMKERTEDVLSYYLKDQCANHGRAIASLYATSKMWSDLAAPHRFKTLRATKLNATYHFCVGPRHHALFTHIDLDTFDAPAVSSLIASIHTFPRLKKLTFRPAALKALFDSSAMVVQPYWIDRLADPLRMLGTVAGRVEELDIDVGMGGIGLRIVDLFAPQLRVLRYRGLVSTEVGPYDATQEFDLPAVLTKAKKLRTLDLGVGDFDPLDFEDFFPLHFRDDTLDLPFPTLDSLSLSGSFFRNAALSFIRVFSPSLRHLSLTSSALHEDHDEPLALVDTDIFPKLEHLELRGKQPYLASFLSSFTSSQFPAVTTFTCGILCARDIHDLEELHAAVDALPRLSELRIWTEPHTPLHPEELRHVEGIVRRPAGQAPVRIAADTIDGLPDVAFGWDDDKLREDVHYDGELNDSHIDRIDRAVEYLANAVAHAKEVGDHLALARLAIVTKPLELERLVAKQ